jgi:hypothetical protein
MWQVSFSHKIILVLLAAACTAGMIEFYRNMVQGADDALNGAYRAKTGSGVPVMAAQAHN